MNAALLVTGLVVCVITLVLAGIKIAQKGGKDRGVDLEARRQLEASAERVARQDRIRSRPLPGNVRTAWERFVRRTSEEESDS